MGNDNFSAGHTRHVVVDMQRLFAEETPWHTPALSTILPNVIKLAKTFAGQNHFAKFMVPPSPDHAEGRWKTYYERWSMLTTDRMDPAMLDIVEPLDGLIEPDRVIEKTTYSIFKAPGVRERFAAEGIDTLVFSGVETDVCVLAGLMEAVDAGFRTVIARDAVGSSAPLSHAAVLEYVLPRMPEQIDMMTTAEIIARTGK